MSKMLVREFLAEGSPLRRNDIRELQKILARAKVEKLSEVIPSKFPFSIALWLKKRGNVSKFVRESVILRLQRMASDE